MKMKILLFLKIFKKIQKKKIWKISKKEDLEIFGKKDKILKI